MSGTVTAGAGVLTAVLVAGTGLSRWWVRPARGGRHRAPVLVPVTAIESGPAPVESLVIEERRCPTCRATTEHVRFALGGLMCPSCPPWGSS